jgi:hypothetical protein
MGFEQVTCPKNPGHRTGGKRRTDLSVLLPNFETKDIVWTWYSECLVSDNVLQFLQSNQFTGFEIKLVKALFKQKSPTPPPSLWEIVVTGWGGIAPSESGISLKERCEGCGYSHYGVLECAERLIDETQWDGSDFFMVWPLPRFIFVTKRVRDAIVGAEFKGAVFKGLQQLVFTPDCRDFSPGRLSYWMPDDRARQLGEPLGIY